MSLPTMAGSGSLDAWTDGRAKRSITEFVEAVTSPGGPDFVAPADRVAVFDNDGTLWTEQPMPIQLDHVLRRFAAEAAADAGLRDRQPWKAAHEHDYGWLRSAFAKYYQGDDGDARLIIGGILASGAGQDVDLIEADAAAFVLEQGHPTLGRPYRTCVYVPMVQLLRYLEANDFMTYIVSGGGRDFMRAVSDELYAIPRERVIGSSVSLEFIDDATGGRILRRPAVDVLDDGPEKPIRVWDRTGRRPLVAGGNSNGDIEMLSSARRPDRPSLGLLIHHDDGDREFAYDAGAERAMARAASDGWTVVSMRDDWTTIFPSSA